MGQLRQQTLHQRKRRPSSVGDIVLIEADNKRRVFWALARVTKLMPGKDGLVRVAQVKTESGELLRPVKKLYYLEIEDSLNSCKDSNNIRTKSGRAIIAPDRLRY